MQCKIWNQEFRPLCPVFTGRITLSNGKIAFQGINRLGCSSNRDLFNGGLVKKLMLCFVSAVAPPMDMINFSGNLALVLSREVKQNGGIQGCCKGRCKGHGPDEKARKNESRHWSREKQDIWGNHRVICSRKIYFLTHRSLNYKSVKENVW